MAGKLEMRKAESVPVVEADIFDRMNETNELIAERAYEIYESRGATEGTDEEDWFKAKQEILPELAIEQDLSDGAVRLSVRLPGFEAKDLEVVLGHQRAVICGLHSDPRGAADSDHKRKKVLQIIELPFAVDPVLAAATLQRGTLQVLLPRLAETDASAA